MRVSVKHSLKLSIDDILREDFTLSLNTEEIIRRSKEAHPGRFTYQETNYTGSHHLLVVHCNKHGRIETTYANHMRGFGCIECGKDINRNKNKAAAEAFHDKAQAILGDNYDVSEAEYKSVHDKVKIICKKHKPYWMTPGNILSGQKCPTCSLEYLSELHSLGNERFAEEGRKLFGEDYNYSLVDYKNAHTFVKIICNKCGDTFEQKPMNHLVGMGCNACGRKQQLVTKRETYSKQFFEEAPKLHGDKYRYNLVEYKTSKSNVEVICMSCRDSFKINPVSHLTGSGCRRCAKNGFQIGKQGNLYVLSAEGITKIGITNRLVSDRILPINRTSGYTFRQFFCLTLDDGEKILEIEQTVLKEMKSLYNQPDKKFDGFTECFLNLDPNYAVQRIKEIAVNLTE